jgi:HlyD family secretion protein
MKAVYYMAALVMALVLAGCERSNPGRLQGYVEGEFVYVASPLAGALDKLAVQRGTQVRAQDPLFSLECGAETAAREQAVHRLEEGRAKLADARKGMRPSELESLEAQVREAKAALTQTEADLTRQMELAGAKALSAQELDRAKTTRNQDQQRLAKAEAELTTARLGSRADVVAAAEANVAALTANLAKAEWDLAQKRQAAPHAGVVFDTLYQEGEWVPAGRPVLSLLPPERVKVRTFVPEKRVGSLHLGDVARVYVDGVLQRIPGTVRFISPQAEFTPPVIYSQQTREKLVFLVELRFAPGDAMKLHPGQPVDVEF